MLDVETDLQVRAYGFDRHAHFGKNLVLSDIEEAVPGKDFRIFHQQAPELDEITIARPFVQKGFLHELVQLLISLFGACKIDALLFACLFVMLAKASHPPGSNALGMTCPKCVEQWTVALIEEQNAIDIV